MLRLPTIRERFAEIAATGSDWPKAQTPPSTQTESLRLQVDLTELVETIGRAGETPTSVPDRVAESLLPPRKP